MNEIREEYKKIVLRAARFAAKGGAISATHEDFIMDNLDRIVDRLSEADFDHLLFNRKIPLRDVETDEEYRDLYEKKEVAADALRAEGLTEFDRKAFREYFETLDQATSEFKQWEWGRDG